MAKKKSKFMCSSCGYEAAKWMGRCPGCGEWNTMNEEIEVISKGPRGAFQHSSTTTKATPIINVEVQEETRIVTQMEEFNRVLGGGIVPGSLVLIGGDPGIGKSTLLLQVSALLSNQGKRVLYISGEESVRQTKLRAERLGVKSAAVIFMGISKLFVKNGSVLENNMVQTIASAGEAVASGSIFTIPAIYFWAYSGIVEPPSMLTLTMIALCGGVLGVLFMIPLREMLIVKEHGVLPYPEGTACAEVLLSAEKKGTSSKNLFVGIILASLIKFVSGSLRVIPETVNLAVKSLRTAAGVEVSPAFIAVGYICGLRVSACLFAGGLLSWLSVVFQSI